MYTLKFIALFGKLYWKSIKNRNNTLQVPYVCSAYLDFLHQYGQSCIFESELCIKTNKFEELYDLKDLKSIAKIHKGQL